MSEEKKVVYDFTVDAAHAGKRIDAFFAETAGDEVSRTYVQKLIRDGLVTLNGAVCTVPRTLVAENDKVYCSAPEHKIEVAAAPENIPLDVLYEDEHIIVINKPAGMVVHPGAGNSGGTVVNAVLGREPEMCDDEDFDPMRPGIVHRLDKDTSGVLLVAKTPRSLRRLARQFASREVEKTYAAIVLGWPVPRSSVITTYIGRNSVDRRKMCVVRDESKGRIAVTSYSVVKQGLWNGIKAAVLKVRLHTGRTHQIRVHMSSLKYPLAGDTVYGLGRKTAAERQMLHARSLAITHPETGERMTFTAPFPQDFQEIMDAITEQA